MYTIPSFISIRYPYNFFLFDVYLPSIIKRKQMCVNSLCQGMQNLTQLRFLYPMMRHRPIHVSSLSVRKYDVKLHKKQVHDVSRVILSLQS